MECLGGSCRQRFYFLLNSMLNLQKLGDSQTKLTIGIAFSVISPRSFINFDLSLPTQTYNVKQKSKAALRTPTSVSFVLNIALMSFIPCFPRTEGPDSTRVMMRNEKCTSNN